MKKAGRILLRVGIGCLALLAAGMWSCLDDLDYQPYFRTPYYTQTVSRWTNQIAHLPIRHGEFEAGFGRAILTPRWHETNSNAAHGSLQTVPLAGYGQRQGRPAQGVHDEVLAKAMAWRMGGLLFLMISADALIIPRNVAEMAATRLKQEFNIERAQIYFGATHTHASLGGWGKGFVAEQFAGPYQPAAVTWFADRLAAAAQAAVADLKPAAAGYGEVAAREFVRNRLVGSLGRVDPALNLLVVKQSGGITAVIGSYAAHATVLPANVMEFSGDYPGCWQRFLEESTGGMAVFFAGGTGSHSPRAGAPSFAGAERMGQGLAQIVLDKLPQIHLTNQVTLGMFGLEVTLPELHARLSDGIRLRPWLARHFLPVSTTTMLQVFMLDQCRWVSAPCDFSGELALEIKESCRARGLDVVITSFNGDYIGYVIPDRYYHLDGYEPRLMSFFGPNVPDYFAEMIQRVILGPNPAYVTERGVSIQSSMTNPF